MVRRKAQQLFQKKYAGYTDERTEKRKKKRGGAGPLLRFGNTALVISRPCS
jgi:hypothetical protein